MCLQGKKESLKRENKARSDKRSYSDKFFGFADINCTTHVNIDDKISPFSSKQDLLDLLKDFETKEADSEARCESEETVIEESAENEESENENE